MTTPSHYDVSILGGGLAGLALSIQLTKSGYSVALFEKEKYPFHKVCGEYISMESWDFIESLGLRLSDMELPQIRKLIVTAPNGKLLQAPLPLGGFGISRFKLDHALKEIAIENGVGVYENCKATDVHFSNDEFLIQTTRGTFKSKVCCGSFGKKSNLDLQWKRSFSVRKPNKLNNFLGVKYHIKTNFPADTIALHNFKNGYCGISKVEEDKYCLCYLTNAENLKSCNNSIEEMELKILRKNPHLDHIFKNSEKLFDNPVTISHISFDNKTQVENHVLMVGDAAGMISPLSGNGMSMALHGSKIAFGQIDQFLSGLISRSEMERVYRQTWKTTFSHRLRTGRWIQSLFGNVLITNLFIGFMKRFPFLSRAVIRQTHGDGF